METATARRSHEHVLVLLVALAAPLALVVLGHALHPDPRGYGTHEQLGFQPCWPMAHWNFPCPGCGVTTAISLAAHGELWSSLRTQPFGLVVLATALGAASWALAVHARGRDLRVELARLRWSAAWRVLLALVLLAWLYKIAAVRGWIA